MHKYILIVHLPPPTTPICICMQVAQLQPCIYAHSLQTHDGSVDPRQVDSRHPRVDKGGESPGDVICTNDWPELECANIPRRLVQGSDWPDPGKRCIEQGTRDHVLLLPEPWEPRGPDAAIELRAQHGINMSTVSALWGNQDQNRHRWRAKHSHRDLFDCCWFPGWTAKRPHLHCGETGPLRSRLASDVGGGRK